MISRKEMLHLLVRLVEVILMGFVPFGSWNGIYSTSEVVNTPRFHLVPCTQRYWITEFLSTTVHTAVHSPCKATSGISKIYLPNEIAKWNLWSVRINCYSSPEYNLRITYVHNLSSDWAIKRIYRLHVPASKRVTGTWSQDTSMLS